MRMTSKLKYRRRNEPDNWLNMPRHKNTKQMGGGASNSGHRLIGKSHPHPIGLSGRALSTRGRR